MRPPILVVAVCLLAYACAAEKKNTLEPIEENQSEPQKRPERCTTCSGNLNFNIKSPNDIFAQLQAQPGAEIHTQQSFESCSSDKGCAGLKVKDGRVIEKFGNVDAFKAAAASDTANEFTFHAGGGLGSVFEGGVPPQGPFWWMNQNSPFKTQGGGNFEKFSKSSSSYSSTGNTGAGAGAGGASFTGTLDISGNPFLNGDFAKLGADFAGKPNYQSSSFESSSFSSSNKGDIDLSKNPFLNGGFNKQASGFQAQGSFGGNQGGNFGGQNANAFAANNQFSSGNKFTGYTGSSPSPFTASTSGSNVNLIQNTQKNSEFDFEQQSNIDEAFQGTGNVHAHEHSGGELQQTCAGQGYVCVHKAQCNNGVVNTNGGNILQAKTKKQYCNIKTEICCRIEISTLAGAGGLQGSLGVGSATYSGQGASSQGGGLFVSSSQGQGSAGSSGSAFGQGQAGQAGQSGQAGFGSTTSFGSSSSSFGTSGSAGSSGSAGRGQSGQAGQSGFGVQGSFGSGSTGSGSTGSGSSFNSFGQGGSVNRETSTSTFESRGTSGSFGSNNAGGFASNGASAGGSKFGATGSGSAGSFGFGVTAAPGNTRFGSNGGNEVTYKQTSQTNFIETDSFSAGSENTGSYRPGTSGLKPGIPYLPPVDATISGTNVVSSTYPPRTTPRPVTRPTYLPPPVSTAAPGYLPPEDQEGSINQDTRIPSPPTYEEGSIILDETRPPRPKPPVPVQPSEVPSGCAAALKCTPVEFCTADGVISNTTIALTRDQEAFRVPLTDCKDLSTGRVGKCCRDPFYTDPWPVNQLGKWVPGVFGGNDGKYSPDSRGSGSGPKPVVTARPPITGSTVLNNFRAPKPTVPPYGPNQVTPGFPAVTPQTPGFGQKGQFEVQGQSQFGQRGQGSFSQGGQGQYTQGGRGQIAQGGQGTQTTQGSQFTQTSQSSFGSTSQGQGQFAQGGKGQFAQGGQGAFAQGGQGAFAQGGQGAFAQGGKGQFVSQGQGQAVSQGQGQFVSQGQGQYSQGGRGQFSQGGQGQIEIQGQGAQGQFGQTTQSGQGQRVTSGQGQSVSQGFGSGIRQGSGFAVSQGAGFGVENEYSESAQRVFLSQYSAGGQCGYFNGQKPFGNRNELEVDFAEIPWQAMVLLQTNRSLLCGGVITRPDVVVTSAACVDGLQAKNVLIKGGEWKLGIDDEPLPFQIVQVKNILRHPFYKRGSLHNDVAILVLSENLRLAKNIYPICLPRSGETLDAFYNGAGECIVTGWGKQVLQAHLSGSILHSVNVSLLNPGECQSKLSSDYPHLLEQYDQDSCACGVPTNPVNNICKVDIGSALACTTDNQHWTLRGVYSWDSGCQLGNQLAAFFKFDLEWYEWAIGLIESSRFAQFSSGSQILSQNRFASQINSGIKGGAKGGANFGAGQFGQFGQGFTASQASFGQGKGQFGAQGQGFGAQGQGFGAQGQGFGAQGQFGQGQFSQNQYSQFSSNSDSGANFGAQSPLSNSFSASYSEKKVFQTEPKIVTYTTKPEIVTFTTKPEIVTFTTKPEYFTYTTKPKYVSYTTKPQIITYETSGSGTNPQYVAPGVTFNPSFSDVVGAHSHTAECKCLNGKK